MNPLIALAVANPRYDFDRYIGRKKPTRDPSKESTSEPLPRDAEDVQDKKTEQDNGAKEAD